MLPTENDKYLNNSAIFGIVMLLAEAALELYMYREVKTCRENLKMWQSKKHVYI